MEPTSWQAQQEGTGVLYSISAEGRASTNLGIEDTWREERQGKDTCCTKHVFIIFSLGALVSKPL